VGEDISKFGLGIKMMPSPGSEQGRGRSCADRVSDTTSAALSAKPGEQRAEFCSSQPVQESPTSAHSFSRVGPGHGAIAQPAYFNFARHFFFTQHTPSISPGAYQAPREIVCK